MEVRGQSVLAQLAFGSRARQQRAADCVQGSPGRPAFWSSSPVVHSTRQPHPMPLCSGQQGLLLAGFTVQQGKRRSTSEHPAMQCFLALSPSAAVEAAHLLHLDVVNQKENRAHLWPISFVKALARPPGHTCPREAAASICSSDCWCSDLEGPSRFLLLGSSRRMAWLEPPAQKEGLPGGSGRGAALNPQTRGRPRLHPILQAEQAPGATLQGLGSLYRRAGAELCHWPQGFSPLNNLP